MENFTEGGLHDQGIGTGGSTGLIYIFVPTWKFLEVLFLISFCIPTTMLTV